MEEPLIEEDEEGCEISAAVDVSLYGPDNVFRPVLLGQDTEIICLTVEDAKRLHKFLGEAIPFVEEYLGRTIQ